MNWIKKIWQDTGELSTRQLCFKYLLPLVAIILTWIFIGKIYLNQIKINSLVANTGQVTNFAFKLEEETTFGSRYSHDVYPLKINLSNYNFDFRLREDFSNDFRALLTKMPEGDTITIFTLGSLQSFLCLSSQTDVYEIVNNGKTIFPLDKMRNYNLLKAIPPGIICLILWILYYYYRKGRIN